MRRAAEVRRVEESIAAVRRQGLPADARGVAACADVDAVDPLEIVSSTRTFQAEIVRDERPN